jgi:copper(I)-binding protein
LVAIALLATAGTSAAFAAARAVVEQPVLDVGKVAKGEKIEASFTLSNTGDATLLVREVKPSCGCTVARYDASIPAGESGQIATVVRTENFSGPIAKSVTVFTNDSDNPKITLVIKADVQPQIEVRPGYVRFIVVEGPGSESSTQTLRSVDGPALEVLGVRSPFPFVKASYSRLDDGEDRWAVELKLDRNRAALGPIADFVEVQTNHPKQPVVKIPVSGFIRPVVSVTPRVAELGSRSLESAFTTTLEVRNQTDAAISLASVSADVAGLVAAIEEVEAGQVYKIVLTLTPEMAKGPFEGKVQITTTSRRRPTIEVDVSGTVL